jgi:hypothetical protein
MMPTTLSVVSGGGADLKEDTSLPYPAVCLGWSANLSVFLIM